jgi:hypothetical protein
MIRRILLSVVALSGLFFIGVLGWEYQQPKIAKEQLSDILQGLGYGQVQIKGVSSFEDTITFEHIQLDKDGFDTAKNITLRSPAFSELYKKTHDLQNVGIEELLLTRGWDDVQNIHLPQLWANTRYLMKKVGELKLGHGQIDASTPAGTFRMESTGSVVQQPDKSLTLLNGRLWSAQNIFILDSFVKGRFEHAEKDSHKIDIDIKEFALNIPHMRIERGNGWLEIAQANDAPIPQLTGQLTSGMTSINEIDLPDLNLTINGDLTNYTLLLESKVRQGAYDGYLSVDVNSSAAGMMLQLELNTKSPTLAIGFLKSLKRMTSGHPLNSEILTPLLLTEGNLRRLEKRLEEEGYNRDLLVTITGPVSSLRGNISTGQTVIELVP